MRRRVADPANAGVAARGRVARLRAQALITLRQARHESSGARYQCVRRRQAWNGTRSTSRPGDRATRRATFRLIFKSTASTGPALRVYFNAPRDGEKERERERERERESGHRETGPRAQAAQAFQADRDSARERRWRRGERFGKRERAKRTSPPHAARETGLRRYRRIFSIRGPVPSPKRAT